MQGACACAAAGLTLVGCGSSATAPATLSGSLTIADYGGLANVGGVALVSVEGSPVAVVRTGATTFLALSRICPHQGATINLSGSGFKCPRHGAEFSLQGTWTGGEPTSNLRSYPTNYDSGTGILTIG
jgi:Rieske Fe-S protein